MKLKDLYKIGLNRDVVMFGTGRDGEEFYQKYQNIICDSYCYDNGEKESFHGIPVKKPRKKPIAEDSKELIVICSYTYNKEMEEQLHQLGYEMFVDFITARWFEYFMESFSPEKETVLFYGFCHTEVIMNGMLSVPEFCDRYNSALMRINWEDMISLCLTEIFLEQSDVVVYEQYVGNKVDRMDIRATKISFPSSRFWAYWPQTDMSNLLNVLCIKEREPDGLMLRGDKIINDMIFQHKSEDEIMSHIMSDDVFTQEEVSRQLKKSLAVVRVAEKSSVIKISDLFPDNYKKIKLYCDYTHLGEFLIREYARRILTYMGFNDIYCNDKSVYQLHTEMPIYPSVARCLELEMIDNGTKYEVIPIEGAETGYFLSFEEFEREYIRRGKKFFEDELEQRMG